MNLKAGDILTGDFWPEPVRVLTKQLFHTVQNPAAKFNPEETIEIVRYVVNDWKRAEQVT